MAPVPLAPSTLEGCNAGVEAYETGDYINGALADLTRAGVVARERFGLWSYVLRILTGVEKARGANFPTAAAAMEAEETAAASVVPNRSLAEEVISFMQAKNGGAG